MRPAVLLLTPVLLLACDQRSAGPEVRASGSAPKGAPLPGAPRPLALSARSASPRAEASALAVASSVPPAQTSERWFVRAPLTIFAEPQRDAMQIGMLTLGDEVEAVGPPVARADCPGGHRRLLPLGFVCFANDATRDAADALATLVRAEGRAPAGAPYPYSYGESLGAPRYVRVPTVDEQTRSEPLLDAQRAVLGSARRAAMLGKDDEVPPYLRGVELTAPADACPPALLARREGEPPLARLGTIAPRTGIAWVAECEAESRTWLVTPERELIPRDRVARALASTARGVVPARGKHIAFVTGKSRPRYRMARYGYFEVIEPALPLYAAVRLTGQKHAVGPATYLETTDGGSYVLADHVATIEPSARPSDVGDGEKWLDLDTRRGVLLAYEGDAIVYAALVAAPLTSETETPGRLRRGRYRIAWKHRARTLGEGAGARAHLPHVMSLASGALLFGDPWQPPLGTASGTSTRLSPADAAWVFAWALPAVPDGWTSRRGTESSPGTWVIVR